MSKVVSIFPVKASYFQRLTKNGRSFATASFPPNFREEFSDREKMRMNYRTPPTTFYHNYRHSLLPFEIHFVPESKPSTKDVLYFHFPKKFVQPLKQAPIAELEKYVDSFYERNNLHVLNKRMIKSIDDAIYNTTSIDTFDARIVAHNLIQYVCLTEADFFFENLTLLNRDNAKLGFKMIEAMIEGTNNTSKEPRAIFCEGVAENFVREANFHRLIWWDVAKSAEDFWSAPQFRAWARCITHHLQYYVNFEQIVIRHDRNKPVDMFSYLMSRTITVGMGSLTPYLLDPSWNLDNDFQSDDYFTRLTYLYAAIVNDILSFPKEMADFNSPMEQNQQRLMNYVKVLMDQGMSMEEVFLKSVADANQLVDKLTSLHDDPNFEKHKKFINVHIKSIIRICNYMIRWSRYKWERIC